MAEVMRSALGNEIFHAQPLSYIILAIWALLGFFGAIRFFGAGLTPPAPCGHSLDTSDGRKLDV